MARMIKEDVQPFSSDRNLHIVAVTACATGVAHTYMAAEQLEKLAKAYRFSIKIETQGVMGLKNPIDEKDIINTELVVIASDITIDNPSRFAGCRVLNVCINTLLLKPTEVIAAIRKSLNLPRGTVIDL